jgi:bacterioferritin-associated ferredoxin
MAKALACRCEDVTLHDLDRAIERGYTDIESLKRYTGFGTGWCQGKWCVALCARRLAERGGYVAVPITARPPLRPVPLGELAELANLAEHHLARGNTRR